MDVEGTRIDGTGHERGELPYPRFGGRIYDTETMSMKLDIYRSPSLERQRSFAGMSNGDKMKQNSHKSVYTRVLIA
jgi:hypothetical protein